MLEQEQTNFSVSQTAECIFFILGDGHFLIQAVFCQALASKPSLTITAGIWDTPHPPTTHQPTHQPTERKVLCMKSTFFEVSNLTKLKNTC